MKKQIFLFSFLILMGVIVRGQTGKVKGVVRDINTKETLIGANVVYAQGKGCVTDVEGNYELELPYGTYELTASYVGYKPQTKKVVVSGDVNFVDFDLETVMLSEVKVVADVHVRGKLR